MPYDSNGNATVTRNRAVTGQTVQAAQVNTPFDDVQSMLSQVLLRSGVAPMTGPLNMNGFKFSGVPLAVNDEDLITLGQVKELISDPWAFVPIGSLIAANNGWGAFTAPPTNKSYRYVILTANQRGTGQYNNGVISEETTTGSSPEITSVAKVSLAGSPYDGVYIRMINTERRFLRAGSPGNIQSSQNRSHTHGVTDGGHDHDIPVNGNNAGRGNDTPLVSQLINGKTSVSFSNISIQNSGGDEARPYNMGVDYYMRIK